MTTPTSQTINDKTIKQLVSLFESGKYELAFAKAREARKKPTP